MQGKMAAKTGFGILHLQMQQAAEVLLCKQKQKKSRGENIAHSAHNSSPPPPFLSLACFSAVGILIGTEEKGKGGGGQISLSNQPTIQSSAYHLCSGAAPTTTQPQKRYNNGREISPPPSLLFMETAPFLLSNLRTGRQLFIVQPL